MYLLYSDILCILDFFVFITTLLGENTFQRRLELDRIL